MNPPNPNPGAKAKTVDDHFGQERGTFAKSIKRQEEEVEKMEELRKMKLSSKRTALPDFAEMMRASLPTPEQLNQRLAERKARQANPNKREALLQNTTKLSDWLARCSKAGISAVPAQFSPSIDTDEIMDALDGKGPSAGLDAAVAWLEAQLKPGFMWRWEQCGPHELKRAMSEVGEIPEPSRLCIDDPRFIDILFECNVATTRVAVRPIVKIARHDTHPIEFRCYVSGPNAVAISNYYPQISLPEEYRSKAEEAGRLALKLHPFVGTSYTADFLLTPTGELVFLEGGPPWGAGAHPCCFNPDELEPGRIALAPETGSVQ